MIFSVFSDIFDPGLFPSKPVEGTLHRYGADVFAYSEDQWVRICSAEEMSKHLEESGYWEELANKSC